MNSSGYKDIHLPLVESCLAGDKASYKKLYDLYSKAMYNVCYRIVRDEDEAKDVLQEGFISAFKNLSGFNRQSTFGAWIKRIMINKALTHVKKGSIIEEPIEEDYDVVEEDEHSETDYNIEKIRVAILKLPDGYRTVFSLYLLEGYDHSEISEILAISESTSKTQYLRAKKKLREILKEMNYEKAR